jgi:hypothetical protein
MGGWYSGDDRGLWYSRGDTFHTFGQWLSAFACMARATDDDAMRDKVLWLLSEWAKTIAPDGYCFFSHHLNAPHFTYDQTLPPDGRGRALLDVPGPGVGMAREMGLTDLLDKAMREAL